MSFFDKDMMGMLDIYQSETMELIEELESYLVQLERSHELDERSVNGIFRDVHTIKSSSAMMGMNELSTCTHRLEDLFLIFRSDLTAIRGYERDVIDLLYDFVDVVKHDIDKLYDENFEPSDVSGLRSRIDAQVQKLEAGDTSGTPVHHAEGQPDPEPAEPAEEIPALIAEKKTFTLKITLKNNCQMEHVRAFMLVSQVKPFCSAISHVPGELEKETAKPLIRDQGLILNITTADFDRVIARLKASPYVEHVENLDETTRQEEMAAAETETAEVTEPKKRVPEKKEDYRIKTEKYSHIAWDKILKLQEVTGELITANTLLENTIEQTAGSRELENFALTYKRLVNELEELVNSASLMPVSSVIPQLYRIVHDICRDEHKDVEFQVLGENMEVDKNLLDAMSAPLIHLIRNAIDHGIETVTERKACGKDSKGHVVLDVSAAGGMVTFSISDDGSGMNPTAILKRAKEKGLLTKAECEYSEREIFEFTLLPGFSTASVANEYSGRGVGMDVVRNAVDNLSGVLDVESKRGQGTRFVITVPVSMTSVECIRFLAGSNLCLIPSKNVVRILSLEQAQEHITVTDGSEYLEGEEMLPVLRLGRMFAGEQECAEDSFAMIIQGIERGLCLIVGDILGHQKTVEKPLPKLLGMSYKNKTGITGCAMIGDGSLGLVLNAEKLIHYYQKGLAVYARKNNIDHA